MATTDPYWVLGPNTHTTNPDLTRGVQAPALFIPLFKIHFFVSASINHGFNSVICV